jgi:hypothetical protein
VGKNVDWGKRRARVDAARGGVGGMGEVGIGRESMRTRSGRWEGDGG